VVAKKLNDRLDRLEGQLRPPDRDAERRWREAVSDMDKIAAIIRDSGPEFRNALARIEEQHPEWSHFDKQLEAKRIIIEASGPDGARLWRKLASATAWNGVAWRRGGRP
jgi:hypothetical protein